MARWEPVVENYLGFPQGLSGQALLDRGLAQVRHFGVGIVKDHVKCIRRQSDRFLIEAATVSYSAKRVLLATGLTHLLPDIPGAQDCLGRSVLFCKDCDAYRRTGETHCHLWTPQRSGSLCAGDARVFAFGHDHHERAGAGLGSSLSGASC